MLVTRSAAPQPAPAASQAAQCTAPPAQGPREQPRVVQGSSSAVGSGDEAMVLAAAAAAATCRSVCCLHKKRHLEPLPSPSCRLPQCPGPHQHPMQLAAASAGPCLRPATNLQRPRWAAGGGVRHRRPSARRRAAMHWLAQRPQLACTFVSHPTHLPTSFPCLQSLEHSCSRSSAAAAAARGQQQR